MSDGMNWSINQCVSLLRETKLEDWGLDQQNLKPKITFKFFFAELIVYKIEIADKEKG